MTENEQDESKRLSQADITKAVRDGQSSWLLRAFWNPGFGIFLTTLMFLTFWALHFLASSENGDHVMQFLLGIVESF